MAQEFLFEENILRPFKDTGKQKIVEIDVVRKETSKLKKKKNS